MTCAEGISEHTQTGLDPVASDVRLVATGEVVISEVLQIGRTVWHEPVALVGIAGLVFSVGGTPAVPPTAAVVLMRDLSQRAQRADRATAAAIQFVLRASMSSQLQWRRSATLEVCASQLPSEGVIPLGFILLDSQTLGFLLAAWPCAVGRLGALVRVFPVVA